MLRKKNIKFTSITRITYGFLCVSIGMAWTAFVQHMIYSTGPNYDYATAPCKTCQQFNSITAAWQIPSYFFIAVSEIFASVTGLEYAFTHAPPSMKSVVMSLFLFTSAISSAFSFALLPITVDPTLTWLYASLAVMAFAVGLVFFFLFRNEQEKEPGPPSSDK
jgi:proton-dependent oligopeptide transporter, POT family